MPTVDWATKVISVPLTDLTLTSPGIYEHDTNAFRLALKALEDDEGMPFPDTHRHNTTVTVGGVTLARTFEIINDYQIEYENGTYAVNLVGTNNNISDVAVVNSVSIRSGNTVGLVQVTQDTGSGLSSQQATQLAELHAMLESSGVLATGALPSSLPTDWITADAIEDTAIAEIQSGLGTSENQTTIIANIAALNNSDATAANQVSMLGLIGDISDLMGFTAGQVMTSTDNGGTNDTIVANGKTVTVTTTGNTRTYTRS